MGRVAIVGAGVMGSALTIPLAENGAAVLLCGTRHDQAVVASIRERRYHPALGPDLPEAVEAYPFAELGAALPRAEVVVIGGFGCRRRPWISSSRAGVGQPAAHAPSCRKKCRHRSFPPLI